MMIEVESLELLERKVLRHLAIKAGRNPGYFVAPTLEGLARATWCDDEHLVKNMVANLVRKGQITPSSRVINGERVYGFTCLPARLRESKRSEVTSELKLTPNDVEFLQVCGIAVEEVAAERRI